MKNKENVTDMLCYKNEINKPQNYTLKIKTLFKATGSF
jgi:hypothetical protein